MMTRGALLILVVSGCGGPGFLFSDFERARLIGATRSRVLADPTSDLAEFSRVMLVPGRDEKSATNPIIERQMQFLLTSALQAHGLRVVSGADEQPQLVVFFQCFEDTLSAEIPAHFENISVWVPPRTWNVTGQSNGTASAFGSGGWANGSYQATSTTSVAQPGYFSSEQQYRPARTVSTAVGAVRIDALDVTSERVVWTGVAAARTNADDGRFASQALLQRMVAELPRPRARANYCEGGWTGLDVKIVTLDGNNFIPVVSRVASFAREAGVRSGDILEFVDRLPTTNQTYAEVLSKLCGTQSSAVEVRVFDGETRRTITLLRRSQAGARWD